jgi:FtsH-binding integral membrane protein
VDRAIFWPPLVKERIQKTYTYFTGGLAVTAAAAVATVRSGVVTRLSRLSPFGFLLVGLGGSLGSYMLCVSVPYENTLMKHSAWLLFSGAWGMFLAPAVMMGGALVTRAAIYTAGTVAGLTITAACAPSDKFLTWAGPLSLGLGAVCVASLGSMFLGPMSSLGMGMYSFSLYGGLLVFGGFMLYDTQKIIKVAETQPHYDPVNESLGIYMDTINIFIRILMILSSSSRKK